MNTVTSTSPSLTRRLVLTGLTATVGLATVLATQTGVSADGPLRPSPTLLGSGTTDDRLALKTHPQQTSKVSTVRLDFAQGASSGWHSHPGAGFVTILEGSFVFNSADGCTTREFTKGDVFLDTGTVHELVATTAGSVLVTFVTDAASGLTKPEEAPDC